MSISLGIYDVFANLIPGLVYLVAISELLRLFVNKNILLVTAPSTAQVIGALGVAYILGHLFNAFSFRPWYTLFNRKHDDKKALESINYLYPDLKLNFSSKDSELLFAALQVKNKEVADKIEVSRVNAIMMRNISFGLFLISLIELLAYFQQNYSVVCLTIAVVTAVASIVSIKQAARYYHWFYKDVFKIAAMYGTSLESIVKDSHNNAATKTKNKTVSLTRGR